MKRTILGLLVVVAMALVARPAMADEVSWDLAPDLTATSDYTASGGNFSLTVTITNNSGTDAGIYDFSLDLVTSGSITSIVAGGSGASGAGFMVYTDTKQNNGSGNTCNTTTNSGWICVDYTGNFDVIASGGSLTWTFTGTYTGNPVDLQHLMAQGCIAVAGSDVTDPTNCVYNGAGSYNISLDGTPVPEPGSLMLFGTGLLGMAGFLRRKLMS